MSMTIAAIADTHVGDASSILPLDLLDLLSTRKPDIILHAGDITDGPKVLSQLSQVAPTLAVKGDNDQIDLPTQQWITTNGRKICLTHGDRPKNREKPSIIINKFFALFSSKLRWWNGYITDLCQPFTNSMPDVIICGHLHYAFEMRVSQTLIVNPGAVYMNGQGIQKNIPPSIAFITVGTVAIETEFVRLPLKNEQLLSKKSVAPRKWLGVRKPSYAE